jgi:oligopeptide/dipeptide ABC transporter ATP-binding protein
MVSDTTTNVLLDVHDLTVEYRAASGWIPVVEDFNVCVRRGEILGLVGESGCGKTTLALALLGLIPRSDSVRISGSAIFAGRDLLRIDAEELRALRGDRLAMIPQDPTGSLNPLFRVGAQVEEAIVAHGGRRTQNTRQKMLELLQNVRLNDVESRARQYPHELSGGMRQRVVGAIATAGVPELLIADEPTTALDVTVQAKYLDMLRRLQEDSGLAVIFITHDLGVVATLCDRVAVMYAGRKVEEAGVDALFAYPGHWYTRALLDSVPPLHVDCDRLTSIPGMPPRPGSIRQGCRFAPRCPNAADKCRTAEPGITDVAENRVTRCWYPPPAERIHD